jgi:hypothetical protein
MYTIGTIHPTLQASSWVTIERLNPSLTHCTEVPADYEVCLVLFVAVNLENFN